MTIYECRRDAARRLADAGIKFRKLTAKTVSFSGFGHDDAVFVEIHGAYDDDVFVQSHGEDPRRKEAFQDVPAPSKGGYVVEWSN
jgi:hypothetical protein